MFSRTNRRDFLGSTLSALGLLALGESAGYQGRAMEAVARKGEPRLRLSLAAYSFRQFFKYGNDRAANPDGAKREIDLFDFIDFCSDQGCVGTELTSYYFPPEVDANYLLRLKRHAFLRGVAISGTAVGNSFTEPPGAKRDQQVALVRRWIDHAAVMGAPHIRVFAGSIVAGSNQAEATKLTIDAFTECCAYAATKGVFLGLENHGGIVADVDHLLAITRAVNSPWFGINLDTGNFHSADPYADLAKCAPYAVNVQVKVEITAQGKPKEATDLARIATILRQARYQGYVALEYEATEDPWTAVPRWLRQMEAAFA